jgi:Calcineurin-like phosphoesterase
MACFSAHVSPKRACLFIFLFLLFFGLARPGQAKTPPEQPGSVVAIGDVHGDFDDFVTILQKAGLIDGQHHWTGGKTTFVQVGDLLDRGPKPREVMDLMMALEKEAPTAGGRVVGLLGNHEMMNIMGDLRYVTPVNYASFADSDSEKRQKSAYQDYVKWRHGHSALIGELPQPMELTEAEWMARHPQGFVEQREAFSPGGSYGKWLREHSAVAQIGGIIFLHGGIHPNLAHLKIETINSHIRDEIKAFDSAKQYLQSEKVILPFFTLQEMAAAVQAELSAEHKSLMPANQQRQAKMVEFLGFQEWLSVRPDGPLWFRGYDQWSEEEGAAQVGKLLEAYKATHIAVGHTVQKGGRIRPRFDNKVFLIDTGMLSSYYPGGRASALEICGDAKITAEYMDQRLAILPPTAPSPGNSETGAAGDSGEGSGKSAALPVNGGICAATAAAAR